MKNKNKIFLIGVINLVLIIGAIGVYQAAAIHRKDVARINQLENAGGQSEDGAASSMYNDGEYTGTAAGFGGDITVKVRIEKDRIEAIEILEASGEDGPYLSSARGVIDSILQQQTTNVDTISGATYSSTGIINAVISAVEQGAK